MFINSPTRIEKVCSTDITRPTLQNVYALASDNGDGAHLTATDGHILAIVRTNGEVPENCYIPPDIFPTKKKKKNMYLPDISLKDGKYVSQDNRFIDFVKNEDIGAHPDISCVIPGNVENDTHIEVSLNADLLLTLAKALNDRNDINPYYVKILISKDRDCISSAIPVIGGLGIGVIMPVKDFQSIENWNVRRRDFLNAWNPIKKETPILDSPAIEQRVSDSPAIEQNTLDVSIVQMPDECISGWEC